MKAALVAIVLVGLATTASARVIHRPSLTASYPGGDRWELVAKCIKRYGDVKILRSTPDVRVIQVTGTHEVDAHHYTGIYVFVRRDGWHVGGELRGEYKLVAYSAPRFGKLRLHRLDVKQTFSDDVFISDEASRPARIVLRHAVFCSGLDTWCVAAMTACDTFIDGKALWTFRGTLEHDKGAVLRINGDRSKMGGSCVEEAQLQLPLPPEPSLQ